jgi:hypothetical protein
MPTARRQTMKYRVFRRCRIEVEGLGIEFCGEAFDPLLVYAQAA